MSVSHLHRTFKEVTHFSFGDYVRLRRISRSLSCIKDGDESILQIALGSGYTTHEAFTRAFKKAVGLSPGLFRKNNGDLPGLLPKRLAANLNRDFQLTNIQEKKVVWYRTVGRGAENHAFERVMHWAIENDIFDECVEIYTRTNPNVVAKATLTDEHGNPQIIPTIVEDRCDCWMEIPESHLGAKSLGVRSFPGGRFATTCVGCFPEIHYVIDKALVRFSSMIESRGDKIKLRRGRMNAFQGHIVVHNDLNSLRHNLYIEIEQ